MIKRTDGQAFRAGNTFCPCSPAAIKTDIALGAGGTMRTVIEMTTIATGLFKDTMVADLLGDRSTVFSNVKGDCFKTVPLVEAELDSVPQFQGKVFVLVHNTSFPAG